MSQKKESIVINLGDFALGIDEEILFASFFGKKIGTKARPNALKQIID